MNLKVLVARKKMALTQHELANEAQVSQPDIIRIEKAGWIPPMEIRERIARALDTTADELFAVDGAQS